MSTSRFYIVYNIHKRDFKQHLSIVFKAALYITDSFFIILCDLLGMKHDSYEWDIFNKVPVVKFQNMGRFNNVPHCSFLHSELRFTKEHKTWNQFNGCSFINTNRNLNLMVVKYDYKNQNKGQ